MSEAHPGGPPRQSAGGMNMRHGSAFTGIGGFDLGFAAAGIETAWQIESSPFCRRVLKRRWPAAARYDDVRRVLRPGLYEDGPTTVDVISGGDPCPIRSSARLGRASRHPDLSGYFLALVGRLRPRWLVRENVPAPDVVDFLAGLEALGYGTTLIEVNPVLLTGQDRRRQIAIGHSRSVAARFRASLYFASLDSEGVTRHNEISEAVSGTLVAHCNRMATEPGFCLEPGRGMRQFTVAERERLAGFPGGWTAGLSRYRACHALGNSFPPPLAEWIGRRIVETEVGIP